MGSRCMFFGLRAVVFGKLGPKELLSGVVVIADDCIIIRGGVFRTLETVDPLAGVVVANDDCIIICGVVCLLV